MTLELTAEQERAVVRRTGSLLLAAGAGSGKTSVLVERFVRAVSEDEIAPGRILAITFTERAAAELRERVRGRLLQLNARAAAQAAESAFVSTFHGFCARLLRAHALQAEVEPGFRILDEAFAGRLRVDAFERALAEMVSVERESLDPGPAVDLVAAVGADRLRTMILGAYAQLRSQGQAAPRLPRADALPACALLDRLLASFVRCYEQLKRERGALDFDDLELRARDLLVADTALRGAWSERFELLMVDEFQDSNRRQLQILAALDRDNLFTVGDELQSIYGFRHAEVSLFREREEHLSTLEASLALTRNFRSRPAILKAVERVFSERMGNRFGPLQAARPAGIDPGVELLLTDRLGWEQPLGAGAETGGPGTGGAEAAGAEAGAGAEAPALSRPPGASAWRLPNAPAWRQAEARALAIRVEELIGAGEARPGEIVLLLRALGDLPLFEGALRSRGVPTAAAVGAFWSHQQVVDLLAWLRALANPLDEPALYSVLASALVGVSSDGLALIAAHAREGGEGVWRAIVGRADDLGSVLAEPDRVRVERFRDLFAAERAAAMTRPIAELLRRAIEASGYERYLMARGDCERRLASVHKLLRLAHSFEAQEGRDLRGFLDHVVYAESAPEGREADAIAGEHVDAVRLMSIHAAKGSEFAVVCLCDLGREPNLSQGDLLADAEGGRLGVRLASLEEPKAVAELDYDELCQERRIAQEEEEDRILYVACTRARERLILSGAARFERWPQPRPGSAPIAWLAPALVPGVVELAVGSQPAGGPVTVSVDDGLRVRCAFVRSGGQWPALTRAGDQIACGGGDAAAAPAGMPGSSSATVAERPSFAASPRPLLRPDAAVSYSSLAELERCGYRYYLERELRLPERRGLSGGRGEGLDPRLRGTIVHALLEHVDFKHPRAGIDTRDVERVARRIGARIAAGDAREIAELLAGALTSEQVERLREHGRGCREHPFAFSLGPEEPLVSGFLDLLVELPSGLSLIVDYKSDRVAEGDDLEQLVQRDYAIQRQLYALAGIEAGAARVEVAHWFLERPRHWVSASFGADQREQLRTDLRARLTAMRERGFVVSQQPHRDLCLTCPGRGGLCSWGESHTMRARSTTLAIAE